MHNVNPGEDSLKKRHIVLHLVPAFLGAFLIAAVLLSQTEITLAARDVQSGTGPYVPEAREVATHLYSIQILTVAQERFADSGGAIEPLGDGLLLATPRGRLAVVDFDGGVSYLDAQVPMYASTPENPNTWKGFRVADILLKQDAPDRYTLFVSHHFHTGECVEIRVSSITLSFTQGNPRLIDDWNSLFTANPCIDTALFDPWEAEVPKIGGGIQIGGKLLMDGAGHLLVAIGDNGWYEWQEWKTNEEGHRAAVVEPDSHLGKLVRIDLATGSAETIAAGFRNPQGFIRDRAGNLWLTEHGPQGGDELNLVRPGLDYGWPHATHGILYGNRVWPFNQLQGSHAGFEEPFYSWIPSIGVSSLIEVDGGDFPLWQGDLLIASLRSNSLFRVRIRQERVVYLERIALGLRIRDLTQLADGRIAFLTDSAKLLLIQRTPVYCQNDYSHTSIFWHDAEEVCIDLFNFIEVPESPAIRSWNGGPANRLLVRSDFEIYLRNDHLIYSKAPCLEEDLKSRFFLRITPSNHELPAQENRELGLNIYDFYATDPGVVGGRFRGGCIVATKLPPFEINYIHTGQVRRGVGADGKVRWTRLLWEAYFSFDHSSSRPEGENGESPPALPSEPGAQTEHPGATLFAAHCAQCHNLTEAHGIGPQLRNVIGRRAGEVAGFNTTDALRGLDIVWTRQNLAQFIADPGGFAPGADKGELGLTEEEARLIADFVASRQ